MLQSLDLSADTVQAIITVSSTSFVIVFGVITLIPALLDIFENNRETSERVHLLRFKSYRFLKRLVTGLSMWILLGSAVMLLIADLLGLLAMLLSSKLIAFISFVSVFLSITVIFLIIIYISISAQNLTEEEFETLKDYSDDEDED